VDPGLVIRTAIARISPLACRARSGSAPRRAAWAWGWRPVRPGIQTTKVLMSPDRPVDAVHAAIHAGARLRISSASLIIDRKIVAAGAISWIKPIASPTVPLTFRASPFAAAAA
jgi:hypothetical protein